MGRKSTGKGKHLFLSIAVLILLSGLGCATVEKTTIQVEVSTPITRTNAIAPGGAKEQERTEENSKAHEHLLLGQKFFVQGDYEASLREYKKSLSLSGNSPPGDEALFNMGLIYAHPRNPKRDLAMSLSVFRRLTKGYPQSPWAEQAKIWAEVVQENETLKQVIEKSKQVDIEIEEKKKEQAK